MPSILGTILALFLPISVTVQASTISTSSLCDDTAWGEIRAICPPRRPRIVPVAAPSDETPIEEEIDVAIVGGGLVGLSLAIGLTRAGINCAVYERAPRLRSQSQGILAVKPIGMQALEEIHPDIPARVLEVGCERLRSVMTRVDADGKTTNTLNEHSGRDDEAKYGRKRVGITWHNMQRVLASLLPAGVVRTIRSLSHFTEEGDSVSLHFESGGTARCQAALMCDGVFSTARRQLFSDDGPIYFGQLNWGSVVRTDSLPPDMHPSNAVRHFSYAGDPKWMAMLNDGGNGHTFFQLRVSDPAKALALSGSHGRGGLGLPGAIDRLMPIVRPCKEIAAALGCIPEGRIFERSIVGRRPAPWVSPGGRVVLVGDAAHGMHPNIGQGANTGFESARALIRALSDCKGEWKSGLAAYERVHRPRTDLIQSFANLMGCVQSRQREILPEGVVAQMLDWINTNDDDKLPPVEDLDVIRQFDPLSIDGVCQIESRAGKTNTPSCADTSKGDPVEDNGRFIFDVTPEQRQELLSSSGSAEFASKFRDFVREINHAFDREGVVVIRGLLDDDLLHKLENDSQALINGTPSTSKQFVSVRFGPVFSDTAFREVALKSAIPRFAATVLLGLGGEDKSREESSSLHLLKDAFLVKGGEKGCCGWHVDDAGFWPTSARSRPGVNAWIAIDDIPAQFGGGLGVSPRSHQAGWRRRAYEAIGSTQLYPEEGLVPGTQGYEKMLKSKTCRMEDEDPEMARTIDGTRKVFDFQRGDVLFHTRWLFHRSMPLTSNGKTNFQRLGKEPSFKRYSIWYEYGNS